jgi:plasmid maintenance system antidote protein VapI
MKAQEKADKTTIKFRFAAALYKALSNSSIESFRKLAKEAGMEPSHIQKISVGQLDVTLTTSIAIANALGISYAELATAYDQVTEREITAFMQTLEAQKKNKGKAKLPLAPGKKVGRKKKTE